MTATLHPPPPAPVDDGTRRELLAAGLALGLGFAACGEEQAPTTGAGQPATRAVRDAYGNRVDVPVEPRRVVAADNAVLPWVLELGVVPVAAGSVGRAFNRGRDFNPDLYALGAAEVEPFHRDQPDLELLARLEPDLIVAAKFVAEGRIDGGAGAYRGLAPLVVVDTEVTPFEQLLAVGRVLGREALARERVDAATRAIARARRVRVRTLSVLDPGGPENFFLYTGDEPTTAFLARLLGVKVLPGRVGDEDGYVEVSYERLPEVRAEAIVFFDHGEAGSQERLTGHPLWERVPAVRAANAHYAGSYLTWFGNGGLAALQRQLIEVADFLASASPRDRRAAA